MTETIGTRELIVLHTGEGIVRGTYHKAFDKNSGPGSNLTELNRVGVLFLNSMSPTRAAPGDSAVFWADCFAKCGYPSFRVDSPGFGDSDGDPPVESLSFINTGGYASVAAGIVSQLIARYKTTRNGYSRALCRRGVCNLYGGGHPRVSGPRTDGSVLSLATWNWIRRPPGNEAKTYQPCFSQRCRQADQGQRWTLDNVSCLLFPR